MCGIAGAFHIQGKRIEPLQHHLNVMNDLIAHRGPDDQGTWLSKDQQMGLAHRRLSIIDLAPEGHQPMVADNQTAVAFNGEIYNYRDLQHLLKARWSFKTQSDTESILACYDTFGIDCLQHLRGMFAFAIADQKRRRLMLARDRFGIKPLYYTIVNHTLYFASEIKALLPFIEKADIDNEALSEYFVFQYNLGKKTLFKDIYQLQPGHYLVIEDGRIQEEQYWDVHYDIDFDHTEQYFTEKLTELMQQSIEYHTICDVPMGAYLSGGIDSSLMSAMANEHDANKLKKAYHGTFRTHPGYDESHYANIMAKKINVPLDIQVMTAEDFKSSIEDIIYHLDVPVAGPGSFGQYHVAKAAAADVKTMLAGLGGDEIFGGYARYTLAYFEQCIKAAIEGRHQQGHFVVTPESIIPNLSLLQEYKPMIKSFWREGLFGALDERYFRLTDRSQSMTDIIDWRQMNKNHVEQQFYQIFNRSNVGNEAYFDKMTHYDFKCLLPALLHVEDRMSMAHGLETRVPFLDHPLVEFAATIPADIKFKGGQLKRLLKNTFKRQLPEAIVNRRDKMGFPWPMKEWFGGELKDFVLDIFASDTAKTRSYLQPNQINHQIDNMGRYSRNIWALLSLELWQQLFIDNHHVYRKRLQQVESVEYSV